MCMIIDINYYFVVASLISCPRLVSSQLTRLENEDSWETTEFLPVNLPCPLEKAHSWISVAFGTKTLIIAVPE